MPIYEYKCDACETELELLIRGDETPECSSCGSAKLTKQFSVPSAHSNGSGSLPMMPRGGG